MQRDDGHEVPAPPPSFVGRVLFVAGVAALFLVFREVIDALALLFAGVLLGLSLRGLGDFVARHSNLAPQVAMALCAALIAVALAGGLWFFGAEAVRQLDDLLGAVRSAEAETRAYLKERGWGRQILEWAARADFTPNGAGLVSRLTGTLNFLAQTAGNTVIVVAMGLFIAFDPEWYRLGAVHLFPQAHRERVGEVLSTLARTLRRWVRGRVISMFVVGVLTTIGLYLLGSPAPLALGLFTFLVIFIPFFGPIIATIPAALAATQQGPMAVAYVVMLYVGIQIAEGFLLVPFIDQASVELPAAVIIGAQLVMGALLGVIGVVLATPFVATAAVLVRMLYVEDVLGEKAGLGAEVGADRDEGDPHSATA